MNEKSKISVSDANTWAYNHLTSRKRYPLLLLALSLIVIGQSVLVTVLDIHFYSDFFLFTEPLFLAFAGPPVAYVISSLFLRPAIRLASANQASWKDLYSGAHKWSYVMGILLLLATPLVIVPGILGISMSVWNYFYSMGAGDFGSIIVLFVGAPILPPLCFPLYYWISCCLVSGDYSIKQSFTYGLLLVKKYYFATLGLILALEVLTVFSFGIPALFFAPMFTLGTAHIFNQMREKEGLLPAAG